ncbi:NUDIX domain-containing protein [Novosphingobium sp. 9U]|uniref:NUDIX domain-containing protein n=1 Tax=Novosphingobium sp. 9U TaxID=2653158 RepID=UPI001359410A|nr:NUDIX domain-containing protein [Novosphingobium sp. 9U]
MAEVIEVTQAILVDDTGRLLVGLRSHDKVAWPNCWDAIGGKLDKGESPAEALARELNEELGITPTAIASLGSYESPGAGGSSILRRHMFALAEWNGGEPTNVSGEHTDVR